MSINVYLQMNSGRTSLSPLLFEPFKRAIWILDSKDDGKKIFNSDWVALKSSAGDALLQWHKAIWLNGYTFFTSNVYNNQINALFDGEIAPLLMKEVELKDCKYSTSSIPIASSKSLLALSMVNRFNTVPIYSISSKLCQIKRLENFMSAQSIEVSKDLKADTLLLGFQIEQFLACFSIAVSLNSLGESEFKFLKSKCENIIPETLISMVLDVLDLFIKTRFENNTQERGLAWVKFGLLFLECYIPDLAFDPVEMRKAKLSFLTAEIDQQYAKQKVDGEFQILKTGVKLDSSNNVIAELERKEVKWKFKLPFRPENGQMAKREVLEEKKIKILLENLQEGNACTEQELSLQEILSTVTDRLEKKYPYYSDLIQPVLLAIFQIKYGLRITRTFTDASMEGLHAVIMKTLLNFNSSMNLQEISIYVDKLSTLQNTEMVVSLLLAVIKNLIAFRSCQLVDEMRLFAVVAHVFGMLNDLWSKSETERLLKLEQENTIYKTQSHHIETQDEEDEAEYKKLFPDYTEDFADIDTTIVTEKNHSIPLTFDTFAVMSLFEEFNKNADDFPVLWAAAYSTSFNAASDFARAYQITPGISLDPVSHNGCVFMCRNIIQKAEQKLTTGVYDFYNDPNVYEATKVGQILYSFDAAIGKALSNWPDHAVLLQLSSICKRILSFTASSPLMKFLTGLEMLLVKSEDWEKYASREYSLKFEISKLVELIVQWRKLELDSWRDLIHIETQRSNKLVSFQWFHLWKVVIGIVAMEVMLFLI